MRPRPPRRVSSSAIGAIGAIGAWLLICTPLAGLSCGRMSMHHGQGTYGKVHTNGPPPHAPAHGYRHKHQTDGVELVFDSGRGVYLVVGFPGCYFLDDAYYRRAGQQWQMAFSIGGVWKSVAQDKVPPGLRREGEEPDESSADHPGKGKGNDGKRSKDD